MNKSSAVDAPATDNLKVDAYFDFARSRLAKLIGKRKFFHDMLLRDGLRTGSHIYGDSLPPNYHLWPLFRYLGEIDLSKARCLDIGTFDGMTAFVLAELGAREISATCLQDLERFRLVRAYQKYSNISYYPETSITDLPKIFDALSFDLVVISTMLHHLTSPLDALLEARRLVRQGGLFILESIMFDRDEPALLLNTELEDPVFGAPTLFVPTIAALRGMLKLASFELISETRLLGGREARESNYERVTLLARAVKPSEVMGRSVKLAEIQSRSPKIGGIDFEEWETDAAQAEPVDYRGASGAKSENVWTGGCNAPLCPSVVRTPLLSLTRFSVGLESDFLSLAQKYQSDAFSWKDVYLLGARYPGETMPEGMSWGLKQLGNLHALDYIRRLGLADVIEVGPGINFYFPNHIPSWCKYTGLDAPGFYDEKIMEFAKAQRPNSKIEYGLLGAGKNNLPASAFDACISTSVLEHIPAEDIKPVCDDMFRILRPGGWAVHSIDVPTSDMPRAFNQWLDALRSAGFVVDSKRVIAPVRPATGEKDGILYEPLSIRARYYGRYKDTVWKKGVVAASSGQCATILAAAQKP